MRMHAAQRTDCELAPDKAPGSGPLKNPQHEKLAREFAAGASMAEAWRTIGRDPSVGNQSRTFRRPEIQERIAFLQNEFNRMAGISLAALQARLLRIADANIVDFFEVDPTTRRLRLRDLTMLSRSVTTPIAELRIDGDGATKLKIADRLRAIDSLLKTIGGFAPEQHEHKLTLEDLVRASMTTPEGSNTAPQRDALALTDNRSVAPPGVRRDRL